MERFLVLDSFSPPGALARNRTWASFLPRRRTATMLQRLATRARFELAVFSVTGRRDIRYTNGPGGVGGS